MYSPFEFNNLLGPLMALGLIAKAILVGVAAYLYAAYLREQDEQD